MKLFESWRKMSVKRDFLTRVNSTAESGKKHFEDACIQAASPTERSTIILFI